jgi:hypothetical protein
VQHALLSDEDFVARRSAAEMEIEQLSEQTKLAAERRKLIDEQVRRAVDLATYGVSALERGSMRKRRRIVHALGRHYSARDGRLRISIRDWIVPIGEAVAKPKNVLMPEPPQAPGLDVAFRYDKIDEFTDNGGAESRSAVFASPVLLWLAICIEIRTWLVADAIV